MTEALEKLYDLVAGTIQMDEEQEKKLEALSVAKKGVLEVLETPEAKERLWRQGDQLYYKQGVNDPDYCVLRFNAVKGRYYHNFQSEDFEVRD